MDEKVIKRLFCNWLKIIKIIKINEKCLIYDLMNLLKCKLREKNESLFFICYLFGLFVYVFGYNLYFLLFC